MTLTEHLGFDVLSAPVNAADRRALSEAWYSALYATRNAPQVPPSRRCVKQTVASPPSAIVWRSPENAQARPWPATARRPLNGALRLAEANGPRTPRGPLARSIERALFRSAQTPRRASFTLGGGDGRVHIVVQTSGSHVRLIAFCAPKARTRVVCALAQIRWDLSGQGFEVHASIGGDS